ncbi:hypothetical protein CO724_17400 [Ectopseudomonas mendocina]|nr:hypothetical protein CO724_17400 [Pseudomonas mendocina]
MSMNTPNPEQIDEAVRESMAEMPAVQRIRLEHYARSKGMTPEQATVQIVTDYLAAEASR